MRHTALTLCLLAAVSLLTGCEALGIERPIVLGQSFGGFVAQRRARPE